MVTFSVDGGRKPRVSDDDILAVLTEADDPVLSTAEVADALPIKRRGTLDRLRNLEERGAVASKNIGGRNTIWWRADDGADGLTGRRDATEADAARVEGGSSGSPGPTADGLDEPPVDASDDALATVEFPGGRDREACEAAVYAARDYLKEHGAASMRELVTEVMPEHSLGYDVPDLDPGDRYRGSWWRRVVKPGLNALPDVAAPAGGRKWRYTGESGR